MTFIAFCLALAGPVDLEDLAARRDFVWTADGATGRHLVKVGSLQIAFAPNLPVALRNGVPMPLSAPVVVLAGRVKVPAELAAAIEEMAPERRGIISASASWLSTNGAWKFTAHERSQRFSGKSLVGR